MKRRPSKQRRRTIHNATVAASKHLADKGLLIEAGFAGMIEAAYPRWKEMPREQLQELRAAFFGGAQHLYGSIMSIFDDGEEATAADMRKLELIHHELNAFIAEYMQRHGITDPDIGPEDGRAQ